MPISSLEVSGVLNTGGIGKTAETPKMDLSDYELLSFIGRGGYGDVWLARDGEGKYWAVKIVYRSSFDDARPYDREYKGILRFFPVSAQSESQLRVMHVGRRDEDGCFYYIMELADDASGAQEVRPDTYTPHTLRSELTQRRRIPATEVCALGWSLTNALENLHSNGLVHRDIKPGNIIFVGGRPKLADVGLVTDADLTRTFAGTEGYIPPEGPGTYRADIYSLGITLYEACTGCDRREFPALPENVAELPDHGCLLRLIRVVNRACQPDRRKRYQTATEFRRDLERVLRGGSVSERRSSVKRLVPIVAGALMLVAAFGLYKSRNPSAKVLAASTNPPVALVPPEGTNNEPEPSSHPRSSHVPAPLSTVPTVPQSAATGIDTPEETEKPRAPIVRPSAVRVPPTPVKMINPKEELLKDAKKRLEDARTAWNQATAARVIAEGASSRFSGRRKARARERIQEAQVAEARAKQVLDFAEREYTARQQEYDMYKRSGLPR